MSLLEQVTQPLDPRYREIPLTQGQVAIVDAKNYEALAKFKWCACRSRHGKTFYARRRGKRADGKSCAIHMHREIMGAADWEEVDHKDGNGCHNWEDNMRLVTSGENARNVGKRADNTSGYKGVYFKKQNQKWGAQIQVNREHRHLGYFDTPKEAHTAYVAAAKEIHGEFANFG